jgi:glutathione synthase
MTQQHVFVMDPLERIDIEGDSTFVLMLEAQRRGHTVLFAEPRHLLQRGAETWVKAWRAQVQRQKGAHFALHEQSTICLDEVDAVYMRKDPPFDVDYLLATWLLDRVDRARVVMVNDSRAIRDLNEKLHPMLFPHLMAPTMISADRQELRRFIDDHGASVVKPLLNAGGTGVVLLERGDRNIGSVLDLLTLEGRRHIAVQKFIPAVTEGDKRIILLDGRVLGAINRRPRPDDLRANMHVGGAAEPARLTPREEQICAELGPELSRRGLVFVGIDVIGGHLTEINVTSPTGLQEVNRFEGVQLEAQILDWVEAKRASLRG